jgi:uncharacterized protein YqgV (UPF0045/DUF77 family)
MIFLRSKKITMKATVEISKYPLNADYEPPIIDFIERLNANKNVLVKTNATATQVVGEFEEVMSLLQAEIKSSFEKYGKAIFVMKVLNGELDI